MIVLGVDPGLDGALAWVDATTGALLDVQDMPVATRRVSGKLRREVVPELVAEAVRDGLGGLGLPGAAWVEEVHAMPKQGVSSTFTFGSGWGLVRGVLAGLGVPVERVAPGAWKKAAGLPPGAPKDSSRTRACALWPAHAGRFARKRDEGRAEAALIAWAMARPLHGRG